MHRRSHFWFRFSTTVVVLTMTGCTQSPLSSNPTLPSPAPSVVTTPAATPIIPAPSVSADALWEDALERATSAQVLAQSAQSKDDWSLVSNRWEQAIALLRAIPANSPRHDEAVQKVNEYKSQLATAQQRANITIPNVTLTAPVTSDTPSPEASASPNPAAVALATHLSSVGTTLYLSSADDCAECQQQQAILGTEAIAKVSVVTCTPAVSPEPASPTAASPDPCLQANVTTFPTWQINNQLYPGVQSLEQLAELSGYEGEV